MADFTTSNLIVSVDPTRFATGVLVNQPIVVTFLRDMKASTFTDATVALEIVGTVQRVPITYSYANRQLTILAVGGRLLPSTSYKLSLVGDVKPIADALTSNITGIRDILGNGLAGIFTTEFSTGAGSAAVSPTPLLPINQTSIVNQPVFVWEAIGADSYQVQVSKSNTFETIFWPLPVDGTVTITTATVAPARPFDANVEYWWRVRGVISGVPGSWSATSNFFYGNPSLGVVDDEDSPLGFPAVPLPVSVYAASPAPGTANLKTYPTAITVSLAGAVNTSALTAANLTVVGQAVDGNWDPSASIPVFSPSLNGALLGSGGLTYPAQVDTFQQIVESGPLSGATLTTSLVGNLTKLTLTLPSGSYFKPNNIYTITLDIPELATPLVWTFTSQYSPLFSGVRSVREWIDDLFVTTTPPSDDEILYKLRHNSLYALFIQTYPPTKLDGESWIYDPPVSFNLNNPPFFVRKYVELKTAHDFLRKRFWSSIGGGKTQLGDFSVDSQNTALTQNIKLAYAKLEEELLPFTDKLHGHTNRGYARGSWAQRGTGMHGGANTPGGHVANDNSYLWPRSSRRQF